MASKFSNVDELMKSGLQEFEKVFNDCPEFFGVGPGRVNLIGEHTDYNDGFVFPMALPMVTIVLGRKNNSQTCNVITTQLSADEPRKVRFPVPTKGSPLEPSKPSWANYVKGIVQYFDGPHVGFDALIISSVPFGSGLSSSAALEVATYTFLEALTDHISDRREKALLCQKAEHVFAQVPCGVMDQFIAIFGQKDHAVLIDCRSLNINNVKIPKTDCVFLITNSNVRHNLASGEYAKRRKTCETVSKKLEKKSLRDAILTELDELNKSGALDEIEYKRAKHVITENERTVKAVRALENNDMEQFGFLMNESHDSLRDDYEVSCKELDALVDTSRKTEGVYGSRMTGGGFGGCTITLLKLDAVDKVIQNVSKIYPNEADFYVVTPSNGAMIMNCEK